MKCVGSCESIHIHNLVLFKNRIQILAQIPWEMAVGWNKQEYQHNKSSRWQTRTNRCTSTNIGSRYFSLSSLALLSYSRSNFLFHFSITNPIFRFRGNIAGFYRYEKSENNWDIEESFTEHRKVEPLLQRDSSASLCELWSKHMEFKLRNYRCSPFLVLLGNPNQCFSINCLSVEGTQVCFFEQQTDWCAGEHGRCLHLRSARYHFLVIFDLVFNHAQSLRSTWCFLTLSNPSLHRMNKHTSPVND